MGNICKTTTFSFVETYVKININDFQKLKVKIGDIEKDDLIGEGGFAKVYRVRKIGDNATDYAMKTMSKVKISQSKNVQLTISEMMILRDIQHPGSYLSNKLFFTARFLIDMRWAFCDYTHIYLVMKELKGKDLRFHLTNFKLKEDSFLKQKQQEVEQQKAILEGRDYSSPALKEKITLDQSSFNENQTRYFIAQICLALNYLHSNKIIHRDIKPENILFENDGYLRITDMGIAKIFRVNNSADNSGTPGYMAPEVLCRQNHNYAVDYFAVGVMAFELMFNKRPYENEDKGERKDINFKNEIIKNILYSQVQIQIYNKETFGKTEESTVGSQKYSIVTAPKGWSQNCINFINKCLQRKPTERIGFYDINEGMRHPWFNGIDFEILFKKKYVNIPFNETHMKRSERRNKVIKFLDQEIIRIDKEKQQQDKRMKEEELRRKSRMGETIGEIFDEEFVYTINNNNIIATKKEYNKKQEIEMLQKQAKEEEEMINDENRLKPIQHFFEQYYFDRDRYQKELLFLEQKQQLAKVSKLKQISHIKEKEIFKTCTQLQTITLGEQLKQQVPSQPFPDIQKEREEQLNATTPKQQNQFALSKSFLRGSMMVPQQTKQQSTQSSSRQINAQINGTQSSRDQSIISNQSEQATRYSSKQDLFKDTNNESLRHPDFETRPVPSKQISIGESQKNFNKQFSLSSKSKDKFSNFQFEY